MNSTNINFTFSNFALLLSHFTNLKNLHFVILIAKSFENNISCPIFWAVVVVCNLCFV